MFTKKVIHYPSLKTILMIESFLERQKKPVSKNRILEKIPKKVMRQTLNVTLEYLEVSGKIMTTSKGVQWIFDENKKLKTTLRKAAESFM